MQDAVVPTTRRFVWWIVLGAVLLPCIYLPTLSTRFDFIDDGSLVYPTGPMSWLDRLHHLTARIENNYQHLGPFRPFLHAYWEAEVELLGANEAHWRLARMAWAMVAAGSFLWLLRVLGIRPVAALAATALAMWNPYRNEIWTSLTLAEGVAMPFAITALTCAAIAGQSRRSWMWDIAGMLCALAALGCKNTFVVLVPAQMVLRVLPDSIAWRDGVRRYGRRACLLALPLALPLAHFIYYKVNWHAGQYVTQPATWAHLGNTLKGIVGAVSIDFMAAGLLLALIAVGAARWVRPVASSGGTTSDWVRWRRPLLGGLVLLALGVGVYMPIGAVSGRYAMPAVWGADLWIAVLLSELAKLPPHGLRRVAWVAIGCGLVAVAAANVGKQDKFASRADLLWQTLEYVERTVPSGSCIGWQSGPALNDEEGIHFAWHLHARGRRDMHVRLLAADGTDLERRELPVSAAAPDFVVTGAGDARPGDSWRKASAFVTPYWAGKGHYQCYLWARAGDEAPGPLTRR